MVSLDPRLLFYTGRLYTKLTLLVAVSTAMAREARKPPHVQVVRNLRRHTVKAQRVRKDTQEEKR